MKRLDRYIIRETAVPTVIALIALTFVLVARQLGALLELVVQSSARPVELASIMAAVLPAVLTVTIPTALLIGILTSFGRMSSDRESVAFTACGLPKRSIFKPVLILAFFIFSLNLILSMWVAPMAASQLEEVKYSLGAKQLSFELQPRVFNEDLANGDLVMYVRDVSPERDEWRGILLADLSRPNEPRVTMAQYGRLNNQPGTGTYGVTLFNGSTHIVSPHSPDRYDFSQWNVTTLPIPAPVFPQGGGDLSSNQMSTGSLWKSVREGEALFSEEVEFHRRIALPFACIAFALIGLPLGLSTRRGGRSVGLVISTLLTLVYYMIFIGGTRIAANEQLSPFVGTWAANLLFVLLGILLLVRSEKEQEERFLGPIFVFSKRIRRIVASIPLFDKWIGRWPYSRLHRPTWIRTLDLYVLKRFFFFFILVVVAFVSLFIVVTLFELLPDIVKNNAASSVVMSYFFYLLPQILYWVIPLAVLVAVLISLGTLTKTNETLAAKAGMISLYRLSAPILLMALLLSVGLYGVQDYVLPYSNQRQDEFRNRIKGRAAQTYRDPLRKWMAGSENQIYHYSYFDPELNTFADISVFEFDPGSFGLKKWTFAPRGSWDGEKWVFEKGWSRLLDIDGGVRYDPFESLEFLRMEDGPDYFKKEVRMASQMSYPDLQHYIDDLSQSGFDTTALTVDLYRKLSFPLVSFIMGIIAVPFSFTTGRKGAFYGIGISIALGIFYWATFEFFDTLGGINKLSPLIAAWFPNLMFGVSGLWMLLKVRT